MKIRKFLAGAFVVLMPFADAQAQTLLDISPGMPFDQVKQYVLNDPHLAFQYFGADRLVISDSVRAFIGRIGFTVAFCPGSKYDGKVVSVLAIKTYNADKEDEPIQMISTYHDLFQMMSGDQLADIIGTRTETDQGRKLGYVGVSIAHHLKNGETWDLGLFNRPEAHVQALQLQRSAAVEAVCKPDKK
jgi:hypothetical protein